MGRPGTSSVRGALFWFTGDPFLADTAANSMAHIDDGAVLCRTGRIEAVGRWAEVRDQLSAQAGVHHYPGRLITVGFVDSHVHYSQIDVEASFAESLPEWLDRYAYPAEGRYGDVQHASTAAESFCDQLLRHGTTTALTFCTSHPESVDALFIAATKRNMRMGAGKVLMDRGAPARLLDTAERGYRESVALLDRWHGRGRNGYAIMPRFALGCSAGELDAAGTLWREHPDALLHSHLDAAGRGDDEMLGCLFVEQHTCCIEPAERSWSIALLPGASPRPRGDTAMIVNL